MAQVSETRHHRVFVLAGSHVADELIFQMVDSYFNRARLHAELFSVMYPGAYDAADQASTLSTQLPQDTSQPANGLL